MTSREPNASRLPLIGNRDVWRKLVTHMPAVALLRGPDGVGRRYGASGLAERVSKGNGFVCDKLTVAEAERLAAWAARKTPRKIAVVAASSASTQGWNRLLKLLEELPSQTHVWIIADGPVPVAVASRTHPFDFGFLEAAEVAAHAVALGLVTQDELDLMPSKSFRSFAQLQSEREELARLSNVRAWLAGVERKSREEVFDSVAVWPEAASRLLVRELEAQYDGTTLLGMPLTRPTKDLVIRAIAELVRGKSSKVSALVAGTYLIDHT